MGGRLNTHFESHRLGSLLAGFLLLTQRRVAPRRHSKESCGFHMPSRTMTAPSNKNPGVTHVYWRVRMSRLEGVRMRKATAVTR